MGTTGTIRVLIVDDEPGARRRLERLLKTEEDVEFVAQAGTGREALAAIEQQQPDLVFLDVQMPKMSGIDVVRTVGAERMPLVIFVTAYDQYAVQAFELAALDYLMKPFDDERFEQTLERARRALVKAPGHALSERLEALIHSFEHTNPPQATTTPKYLERIAVDIRGQLRIVPVDTIDFITASGNYVYLHVGEEKLLVRDQMQKLDDKLPPDQFYRIHRSSIVRLDEIERLIVNPGGDYAVRLRNHKQLKVSRNRWGELALRLGIETPTEEGRLGA